MSVVYSYYIIDHRGRGQQLVEFIEDDSGCYAWNSHEQRRHGYSSRAEMDVAIAAAKSECEERERMRRQVEAIIDGA